MSNKKVKMEKKNIYIHTHTHTHIFSLVPEAKKETYKDNQMP